MDRLNLKIPPVAVFLIAMLCMYLVCKLTPTLVIAIPYKGLISLIITAFCLLVGISAIRTCRSVGTTVDPRDPKKSTQLVKDDLFRYSRNPMYFALVIALMGWNIFLANPLSLSCIPLFILYMNRFQIWPEEKALAILFGDEYKEYTQKVGRWI